MPSPSRPTTAPGGSPWPRAIPTAGHSQQFLPRADNSIHNPASGRCVDLNYGNTTPGTQLWLYDCNRSDPQRWTIPTLGTTPLPVPTP
ncbi:RICIN domain-containing protein [Streptomyces sp. NPDC058655]|uniref:RICIN domain-containing protein n=1 Tax=Streptomyces sp. NPDC058655 TaxID=3346577 RepID=UPI003668FDF9